MYSVYFGLYQYTNPIESFVALKLWELFYKFKTVPYIIYLRVIKWVSRSMSIYAVFC